MTKLEAWRLAHGLSQRDVAALTGISQPMVSLAERRLRALAPLTRARMAKRLGVCIDELFEVDE